MNVSGRHFRSLGRRLSFFLGVVTMSAPALAGNYTWTGGGPEGASGAFAVAPWDPDTIYSFEGLWGVFRSDDRGAMWSRLEGLTGFEYLLDLIITDGSMPAIIVSTPGGVYRSTDRGETWSFV